MKYAMKHRFIDHNPVREVERPKSEREYDEDKELVILQPKEFRALFNASETQKDKVLFMMAVLTA